MAARSCAGSQRSCRGASTEASFSKVRIFLGGAPSRAATATFTSTQANRPPSGGVGAPYPSHTPVISRRLARLAPKSSAAETPYGAPHTSVHATGLARTCRRRGRGGYGCRRTCTDTLIKVAQGKRERWRGGGGASEEEEERYGVSEKVEEDQASFIAFMSYHFRRTGLIDCYSSIVSRVYNRNLWHPERR